MSQQKQSPIEYQQMLINFQLMNNQLLKENEQLKKDMNQLQLQLQKEQEEHRNKQKETKKLIEKNKQLKEQVNQLMTTHQQYAQRIVELNDKIVVLKAEKQDQNEQNELDVIHGEKELKHLLLTNTKLNDEIIDLKRRILELEKINTKLINENQYVKEQFLDEKFHLRSQLVDKTHELEELRITNQKMQGTIDEQSKKQPKKPERPQGVVELALEIELRDKEDEIELLKLEKQKYAKDIILLESDLLDIEKKYKSTYAEFLIKNHQEEQNMRATIKKLKEEINHLNYIIGQCEDGKEYQVRDQYHQLIFDNLPKGCEFQYKKINGRKSEIFSISQTCFSSQQSSTEGISPREKEYIELPKIKLVGTTTQLETFSIRKVELLKHKMILRKKSGSELIEGFPFDIYIILSSPSNELYSEEMKRIIAVENITISVDLQTILLGGNYLIHHDGKMKLIDIPKGIPENETILLKSFGWDEELNQYHLCVKIKYSSNVTYSRKGNDLIGVFKYDKQFENRFTTPPYLGNDTSLSPQQIINHSQLVFPKKGFEWNDSIGDYIVIIELI